MSPKDFKIVKTPITGQDLTGKTFGSLKVINSPGIKKWPSGHHQRVWTALCKCGKMVIIQGCNLKSSRAQSCGCEQAKRTREKMVIHGFTAFRTTHPLYRTWVAIRQRCKPVNKYYTRLYGQRGIKVCPRWLSFKNFLHDMESTWKPGLTIERIDVNGDYKPSNCCWITRSEQHPNQRRFIKARFKRKAALMVAVNNTAKLLKSAGAL